MLLSPIANEALVLVTFSASRTMIHMGNDKRMPKVVKQVDAWNRNLRSPPPQVLPPEERRNAPGPVGLDAAGCSWLQTISKGFGLEQAFVVFRFSLGKQGDGTTECGVHAFRLRVVHQTSNDHIEVPIAIGTCVPNTPL